MRSAVARQHGLDEGHATQVFEAPETLEPHQRAAVALADALMTRPGDLSDQDLMALRTHFTASQMVELTLDVMKWNYQKVSVATGTDVEIVPGALPDLIFDENGHWVRPE